MDEEKKFNCCFCDKIFKHSQSMYKHVRRTHNVEPNLERKNITCPELNCKSSFSFREQLRSHIILVHNTTLEFEEKSFPSYEEFKLWKTKTEKEQKCFYFLKQSKNLNPNEKMLTFYCHRSGTFSSNSTQKRQMKSMGSKKINGYCPSSIEVLIKENEVSVKFWKTHFGHNIDIQHLMFSEQEKAELAGKMKSGVSFERILDDVRNSVNGTQLKRIHLLTRKDLHNIAQQFRISHSEKLHDNDAISVSLWVASTESLGNDSPVVFFKKQGEEHNLLLKDDFMLVIMTEFQRTMLKKFGGSKICIDSTHGTNAYDFLLTTVLVIDEFSVGCPVAFCLSNKTDELSMGVFFDSVKKIVDVIHTQVFMSDDAPSFYKAWENVMAPAEHQLLCNWHVDNSWRRNLVKISCKEKKALVYKTLRVLMEEADQTKFHQLLISFLHQLKEDVNTQSFGEYFEKTYFQRPQAWAFCYRHHLGLNTNMHLESMHKTLKYYYLEGKKIKRVDKTINALLKFSRDKLFDRLNKLVKSAPSGKNKKIMESHKRSKEIVTDEIEIIDDDNWCVKSSVNEEYFVVSHQSKSCSDNCQLLCRECNICIHEFSCTCLDNLIRYNICKHIHACARIKFPSRMQQNNSVHEEINEVVLLASADIIPSSSSEAHLLKEKWGMIKQMIDKKMENGLEIDEQNFLNGTFDKIISVMNKSNAEINFQQNEKSKSEPWNKKIVPQQSFFSTKKRRMNNSLSLLKPSDAEKEFCIKSLQSSSGEAPVLNTGDDHSYSKPL